MPFPGVDVAELDEGGFQRSPDHRVFRPGRLDPVLDGQPVAGRSRKRIGFGRHHGVRDFEPEPAVLHPEGKGEIRGLGFGRLLLAHPVDEIDPLEIIVKDDFLPDLRKPEHPGGKDKARGDRPAEAGGHGGGFREIPPEGGPLGPVIDGFPAAFRVLVNQLVKPEGGSRIDQLPARLLVDEASQPAGDRIGRHLEKSVFDPVVLDHRSRFGRRGRLSGSSREDGIADRGDVLRPEHQDVRVEDLEGNFRSGPVVDQTEPTLQLGQEAGQNDPDDVRPAPG